MSFTSFGLWMGNEPGQNGGRWAQRTQKERHWCFLGNFALNGDIVCKLVSFDAKTIGWSRRAWVALVLGLTGTGQIMMVTLENYLLASISVLLNISMDTRCIIFNTGKVCSYDSLRLCTLPPGLPMRFYLGIVVDYLVCELISHLFTYLSNSTLSTDRPRGVRGWHVTSKAHRGTCSIKVDIYGPRDMDITGSTRPPAQVGTWASFQTSEPWKSTGPGANLDSIHGYS